MTEHKVTDQLLKGLNYRNCHLTIALIPPSRSIVLFKAAMKSLAPTEWDNWTKLNWESLKRLLQQDSWCTLPLDTLGPKILISAKAVQSNSELMQSWTRPQSIFMTNTTQLWLALSTRTLPLWKFSAKPVSCPGPVTTANSTTSWTPKLLTTEDEPMQLPPQWPRTYSECIITFQIYFISN